MYLLVFYLRTCTYSYKTKCSLSQYSDPLEDGRDTIYISVYFSNFLILEESHLSDRYIYRSIPSRLYLNFQIEYKDTNKGFSHEFRLTNRGPSPVRGEFAYHVLVPAVAFVNVTSVSNRLRCTNSVSSMRVASGLPAPYSGWELVREEDANGHSRETDDRGQIILSYFGSILVWKTVIVSQA